MKSRVKSADRLSIEERPIEVTNRTIPGHWEGDLLVGKRNQSAIGTLVERTTRFVLRVKLNQLTAEAVRQAWTEVFQSIPQGLRQSLTYNQGSEMAEHKLFTKETSITVYFCHPNSPHERGTNENTNGLLRQFFPKGTNFNQVSPDQLKLAQELLNGRPRKTLSWRKPAELFANLVALKT